MLQGNIHILPVKAEEIGLLFYDIHPFSYYIYFAFVYKAFVHVIVGILKCLKDSFLKELDVEIINGLKSCSASKTQTKHKL